MRILLVSDLHYTLKQLDWVVARAGDYDLVVVSGDMLSIASAVEPDAQIAVVLEYLARIAAKTTVDIDAADENADDGFDFAGINEDRHGLDRSGRVRGSRDDLVED